MQKKSKERLDHALHNEAVCDHLMLRQEFSDWIITTAFYSALQFVSYKIFPYTFVKKDGSRRVFKDLDEYVDYRKNILQERPNKHKLLSDLVASTCSAIADHYDYLLDLSHTARYKNYQQPIQSANKARSYMLIVKKHCQQ